MRNPSTGTPDFGVADAHGSGLNGVTGGVPFVTPPSVITPEQGDSQLAEMQNSVVLRGLLLSATRNDQIVRANGFAHELREFLNPSSIQINTAQTSHVVNAVACDPAGNCVYVGDAGTIYTNLDFAGTVTARTPAGSYSGDFKDVVWSQANAVFVAVGTNGEIQTAPSPGTTWTSRMTTGGLVGTDDITGICIRPSDGLLVAVTSGGRTVRSANATGWSNTALPSSFAAYCIACDKNGVFVAGGSASGGISFCRSTDGITFTTVAAISGFGGAQVRQLVCAGIGGFLGIDLSGSNVVASVDGSSWTMKALASVSGGYVIAAGNYGYVATPALVIGQSYGSADGYSWTLLHVPNYPSAVRMQCVVSNNVRIWLVLSTLSGTGVNPNPGKIAKTPYFGY